MNELTGFKHNIFYMPFDAGSVIAHAEFDTSNYEDGIKKLEKGHESLTASVFKAEVMFELFKKGLEMVVDVVKESLAEYAQAEKAHAQLEAVLKSTGQAAGMTAKSVEDLAGELSNLSTYSKDTILTSSNLLLTFTQIGKDVFPIAQKAVLDMSIALGQDLKSSTIQLGKALNDPIQGMTALKRVGVSFNETQVETIKKLQQSGDLMGAQKLILNELNTEFGGSAEAISKTFGGTLIRIQNQLNEQKETIGHYISIGLKPLADSFLQASISFGQFLEKASTMEAFINVLGTVAGGINVFKNVLKDLVDGVWKQLSIEIDKVYKSFAALGDTIGGKNISVWKVLGAAVTYVGMAFDIIIKFDTMLIQGFLDLWNAMGNVAKVAIVFFQALLNPTKWGEVGKQIDATKDAFTNFGKHLIDNTTDVVKTVAKDFETFGKKSEDTAKKMEKDFKDGYDKFVNNAKEAHVKVESNTKNTTEKIKANWAIAFGSIGTEIDKNMDAMKKAVDKKSPEFVKAVGDMAKTALSVVSSALSSMKDIFDGISNVVMNSMKNELDVIKAKNNERQTAITDAKDAELQTNQDKYDTDAAALQDKLNRGIIDQTAYDTQMKALDAKKTADDKAISKKKDDELKKAKAEGLAEENAQNKKIFEANKANQIANIWINFALGAVSAFAMGIAQLGPIAGSIVGGIMTTLLLGVAIANTAVISQQQFVPAKAKGGMAGGMTRVNEVGGEIITLPDGSQVIPHDISTQIANNSSNSKQNTVNISFAGAQISNQMDLQSITDYVVSQIGRKLELT